MYERFYTILDFVHELQASTDGIGYADVQKKYGVSRRTAERMLEAVRKAYTDEVEVLRHRPLRIRLPRIAPTPKLDKEQMATLNTARQLFESQGMSTYAKQVNHLTHLLKANMKHSDLIKVEADIDALSESEAFVFRPGPKENISPNVVTDLRLAILSFQKVSFSYVARSNPKPKPVTVHPYGFLHGVRQYLVAYSPKRKGYRSYVLSRIKRLKILEGDYFQVDPEFSLEEHFADCFGAFKEKPLNIVWRFDKKVAEPAKNWIFHPSQKVHVRRDGRVEISFRAGGMDEMAWHVITWGDAIEVVQPKKLIKRIRQIKDSLP